MLRHLEKVLDEKLKNFIISGIEEGRPPEHREHQPVRRNSGRRDSRTKKPNLDKQIQRHRRGLLSSKLAEAWKV